MPIRSPGLVPRSISAVAIRRVASWNSSIGPAAARRALDERLPVRECRGRSGRGCRRSSRRAAAGWWLLRRRTTCVGLPPPWIFGHRGVLRHRKSDEEGGRWGMSILGSPGDGTHELRSSRPTAAQHDLARRTHEFAESVIRPVAADYDARQEFPWPVLEEAAARGFYSPLFYRDLIGDPTGLSLPMFMEELFWGCAGIGLAIVMPALGAVGDRPGGVARADAGVGAGMLRQPRRSQARRAGDLRTGGRQRRAQPAHPRQAGR